MHKAGMVDAKLYAPAMPHAIHSCTEVGALTQSLITSFEHEPLNKSFAEYICAYIKALAIIYQ
jgi:hypothetical protein